MNSPIRHDAIEKFLHKPVVRKPPPTPVVPLVRVNRPRAEQAELTQAAEAAIGQPPAAEPVPVAETVEPVFGCFTTADVRAVAAAKPAYKKAAEIAAERMSAPRLIVSPSDIFSGSRQKHIVLARRAALGLLYRAFPKRPLTAFAKDFGLDHSTVLYALTKLGIYERRTPDHETVKKRRILLAQQRAVGDARQAAGFHRQATMAKLTPSQVQQIRRLLLSGWKPAALAIQFDVNERCIRDIDAGRSWKHLGWPDPERDAA